MRWHTRTPRRRAQDLSPDTIIETSKGSAKVLDFGMSAWTHGGRTRALAAASPASIGADAVTILSYVSPEQALGTSVDARTDIFSLGAIVYEMLTGLNPFAGPDPAATLANVTQRAPPPPSSINPDLPKLVDVVVLRALNHALDRRTDRASKLASDLRRCAGLLDATSPSARASRSGRLAARRISSHSKKSAVWVCGG